MYREGEEEDGSIAEWRKIARRRLRRMEGKERSSGVMDGGVVWLRWRGIERKSQTERFLPNLQHNHPMCLRLAWQRHH